MKARANSLSRHPARRGLRRIRRGSATVEFALLAPLLVVLVLWANYFWELQRVRLKAAELSRYVAFERTVKSNPGAIAAEAQERYKDLDGATPTGDLGTAYRNPLTLTVRAEHAPAPLSSASLSDQGGGGLSSIAGAAMSVLGSTAEAVAGRMGLNTQEGAVRATVEISIENGIIPEQIALYTTGFTDDTLDVQFTDSFYLFHDTWRAWRTGVNPADTTAAYRAVEDITRNRVQGVAYAGVSGGVLDSIGTVLEVLGLDFPFSTSYVRDSVMIRPVGADGRHPARMPTRTVPGDVLQAAYWENDDNWCHGNCEPMPVQQKRGLTSSNDYGDNWPMRSYNCRGPYFQGAVRSHAPESVYSDQYIDNGRGTYHEYGDDACHNN